MNEQKTQQLTEFIENGISHFERCMNNEKWLQVNKQSKEYYQNKKEAFQVIKNYIEALKFN